MPVLDARALETDPEGMALLAQVLRPAKQSKARAKPALLRAVAERRSAGAKAALPDECLGGAKPELLGAPVE
jgi:hypothetical protein